MQIDRKLQHNVLRALAEVYPDSLLVSGLPGYTNDRHFMGTLFYLQEHGLIVGGDIREPGQCRSMVDTQITKAGLDFLADDGGLEAMLGRFRLKIDSAELIMLVDESLKNDNVDDSTRNDIIAFLDSLGQDELKRVMKKLVAKGIAGNYELLSSLLMNE